MFQPNPYEDHIDELLDVLLDGSITDAQKEELRALSLEWGPGE